MAKPPANIPIQTTSLSDYTPGTGFAQRETVSSYQLAPYPIANPPIILAMDAVLFQNGTETVTFSQMPYRNTRVNPLNPTQADGGSITISPQDTLMFFAFVQGSSVPVEVATFALSKDQIEFPGPFLSAGTYTTFQAHISSASPTSGTVVGMLVLQRG